MKVLTALSIIIIFLFGCKSKESVLLKLKYEKAEQADYIISVTADCNANVHFKTSIGFTYTIDSINNNSEYFMESRVTSIKTDINIPVFPGPDYNEVFDSDQNYSTDMSDEQRQAYIKYDSVMANHYELGYNSRGEVVKPFTVYDKIVAAPFSTSVFQMPFPDRAVRVGDTWTANVSNPLVNSSAKLSPSTCTFTYTVNEITPTRVIVDVGIEMQQLGNAGDNNINFKGTGVYKINRKNGHVDDGYIKVPLKGCDDALISVTPHKDQQ